MEQEFEKAKAQSEQDYKAAMAKIEQDYKEANEKIEHDFTTKAARTKEEISNEKAILDATTTDAGIKIRQLKYHEDYRNKCQIGDLTKKLEVLNDATDKLRIAFKDLKMDVSDYNNS